MTPYQWADLRRVAKDANQQVVRVSGLAVWQRVAVMALVRSFRAMNRKAV